MMSRDSMCGDREAPARVSAKQEKHSSRRRTKFRLAILPAETREEQSRLGPREGPGRAADRLLVSVDEVSLQLHGDQPPATTAWLPEQSAKGWRVRAWGSGFPQMVRQGRTLDLAATFARRAERQLRSNCVVSPHPFADEGWLLEAVGQ